MASYSEIERIRRQLEAEEQARKQEAEKQARIQAAEQAQREMLARRDEASRKAEEERLMQQAADLLQRVFLDVMRNAPEIQQAKLKEVLKSDRAWDGYQLTLRWGDKFEPDRMERRLLEQFYRPPGVLNLATLAVPGSIVIEDYFSIEGTVKGEWVEVRREPFLINAFLRDTNIISESIARGLIDPKRHQETATKGHSYWHKRFRGPYSSGGEDVNQ